MTLEKQQAMTESPPEYEESLPSNHLDGTANPTDDGRVEINLDSKLAQSLALFTNLPENENVASPPPPYSQTIWQTRLNIVIQVVGSRGDVQPFVALGQELQRVGHRVRIATHDIFRDFVKEAKLGFYPIGGDPAELMAFMVKNPGLIPEMKSLREGEITKKRQIIREMLHGCWNSCIKPDPETDEPFVANAIIANPPSFAHIHCAQALSIPVHIMFTMPWSPTQAFPHPLARLRPSTVGQGMANYLSYSLVQILTWQGLADVINSFRKMLDLEPVPMVEGAFLAQTLQVPHTYCWSPSLIPKPRDWPEHIDVCGFFFRAIPDYKPSTALQEFIEQGKPPIYIGFGSIVLDNPENATETIIEAIRLSGVRAIVSAGWSKLGSGRKDLHENVYFLDEDCPHEWLFPRVSAVIHHGGAGTTACGLSNGRPTVVIPFFGDQYFWGDMIAAAQAGPQPIKYKDLTSEKLSCAINFCLTPEAASKAAGIAKGMKAENGVSAAVASFHRHLSSETLPCDIDSTSPAIWSYKKSGNTTRLSGPVAETLIKQHKIKAKDLEHYTPKPIHIENPRWEPTTAVASSVTSTSIDLLKATNHLWRGPYSIHQQAVRDPTGNGVTAKHVAAMVGSSAMSIPKMYAAILKGFVVDFPLAVTEGLRATPKLYGEKVRDHDPVVDWKSGGIVAGKTFTENFKTTVTDLYTLPATGLEKEGVIGLGKGVSKSLIGTVTKTGSALTGLVAYPAQGISKTIYSAFHSRTRKAIVEAKHVEGVWQLERAYQNDTVDMKERERSWVEKWEAIHRK